MRDDLSSVMKTLADHERRISQLEKPSASEQIRPKKELSIAEFLLKNRPRTDADRTLMVGYYLEIHKSQSPLRVSDLEKGFREAKETVPKNINQAIIRCISKGLMMEAEEKKKGKKTWTLTNTGIEFIESGLGSQVTPYSQLPPTRHPVKKEGTKNQRKSALRRGGIRSNVISRAIDGLIEEKWFGEKRKVADIVAQLGSLAVPGADFANVNIACIRRARVGKLKTILDNDNRRVFWTEEQ